MNVQKDKKTNVLLYQIKTFLFAFNGIIAFFRSERKSYIHLTAALVAVALGWYFHISLTEWMFVSVAIGMVFITELFNTIAELMADLIHPETHKKVGDLKDMAAAAVLIASIVALIIGLIVFVPEIIAQF